MGDRLLALRHRWLGFEANVFLSLADQVATTLFYRADQMSALLAHIPLASSNRDIPQDGQANSHPPAEEWTRFFLMTHVSP
jgi:hypothetical protein